MKICKKLTLAIIFLGFISIEASETILFNAIEKSASVFIAHKLAKGLDKKIESISTNCPHKYGLTYYRKAIGAGYILEDLLKKVIPSFPLIREHLYATANNISLLKKHKIKMVFYVRDLRQRVVSFAHYHLDYIRKGNQQTIAAYKKKVDDPFSLTLDDLIEIHISNIPEICTRINDWLLVYKSGVIPMLITTILK